MSKLLEKYLQLQHEWSEAFKNDDMDVYKNLVAEGEKLKSKFNKLDWLDLIGQTPTISAKIGYFKQMKQKVEKQVK